MTPRTWWSERCAATYEGWTCERELGHDGRHTAGDGGYARGATWVRDYERAVPAAVIRGRLHVAQPATMTHGEFMADWRLVQKVGVDVSNKMACPGCQVYNSTVLIKYESGEACPYCGLSAAATLEILAVRARVADAELTELYEQTVIRADKAETKVAKLQHKLSRIAEVVETVKTEES